MSEPAAKPRIWSSLGSIADLLRRLAPTGDPPGSTRPVVENQNALLQVYLAEYNSLRQEMNTRVQAHHQTFNYLIVVIGAAVAAAVAASTATAPIWVLLPIGAILLP